MRRIALVIVGLVVVLVAAPASAAPVIVLRSPTDGATVSPAPDGTIPVDFRVEGTGVSRVLVNGAVPQGPSPEGDYHAITKVSSGKNEITIEASDATTRSVLTLHVTTSTPPTGPPRTQTPMPKWFSAVGRTVIKPGQSWLFKSQDPCVPPKGATKPTVAVKLWTGAFKYGEGAKPVTFVTQQTAPVSPTGAWTLTFKTAKTQKVGGYVMTAQCLNGSTPYFTYTGPVVQVSATGKPIPGI